MAILGAFRCRMIGKTPGGSSRSGPVTPPEIDSLTGHAASRRRRRYRSRRAAQELSNDRSEAIIERLSVNEFAARMLRATVRNEAGTQPYRASNFADGNVRNATTSKYPRAFYSASLRFISLYSASLRSADRRFAGRSIDLRTVAVSIDRDRRF